MPAALPWTCTRSGRERRPVSDVNDVVQNENESREEDDSDLTGSFVGGGVMPAGQDSNVSILGDLTLPTLPDEDTSEDDETVQSSVTGGSNVRGIMRPTIFLATPTPKTMEEAMTIITKLIADNEIL